MASNVGRTVDGNSYPRSAVRHSHGRSLHVARLGFFQPDYFRQAHYHCVSKFIFQRSRKAMPTSTVVSRDWRVLLLALGGSGSRGLDQELQQNVLPFSSPKAL
jgi:hypothetical protein